MHRFKASLGKESPAPEHNPTPVPDNVPAPAPNDGELPPSYSQATGKESAPQSPYQEPPPFSRGPDQNAGPSNPPQHQQQQQQGQIPRQFPSAFNIYRGGMMSRCFVLAQHQTQPIYVFSIHSGMFESAPVVLHSGPAESLPPLATVEWQTIGPSFSVSLPPPMGSKKEVAEERIEWTSRHGGFGVGAYQFSIEVGNSNVRETFEWRHSRGEAVASLGDYHMGWKLVRLNRGPPGGPGGGGDMNYVNGGFMDSQGNEVVAAYTRVTGSLTKAAKFQFMGTGDSGMLGERWAIVAVITAFALYYREARKR